MLFTTSLFATSALLILSVSAKDHHHNNGTISHTGTHTHTGTHSHSHTGTHTHTAGMKPSGKSNKVARDIMDSPEDDGFRPSGSHSHTHTGSHSYTGSHTYTGVKPTGTGTKPYGGRPRGSKDQHQM